MSNSDKVEQAIDLLEKVLNFWDADVLVAGNLDQLDNDLELDHLLDDIDKFLTENATCDNCGVECRAENSKLCEECERENNTCSDCNESIEDCICNCCQECGATEGTCYCYEEDYCDKCDNYQYCDCNNNVENISSPLNPFERARHLN